MGGLDSHERNSSHVDDSSEHLLQDLQGCNTKSFRKKVDLSLGVLSPPQLVQDETSINRVMDKVLRSQLHDKSEGLVVFNGFSTVSLLSAPTWRFPSCGNTNSCKYCSRLRLKAVQTPKCNKQKKKHEKNLIPKPIFIQRIRLLLHLSIHVNSLFPKMTSQSHRAHARQQSLKILALALPPLPKSLQPCLPFMEGDLKRFAFPCISGSCWLQGV